MDWSPPGSSLHGLPRQEYWNELSFPLPGDLPNPGTEPMSPTLQVDSFFFFLIFYFLYCSGFCHTLKWNSHGFTCVPIPIPPPPPSPPDPSRSSQCTRSKRLLVSCIQPGLVICFTLDNINVSMLFSWNIPPSPSPTESKSLFYTSVSLFLFCRWILYCQATWKVTRDALFKRTINFKQLTA